MTFESFVTDLNHWYEISSLATSAMSSMGCGNEADFFRIIFHTSHNFIELVTRAYVQNLLVKTGLYYK